MERIMVARRKQHTDAPAGPVRKVHYRESDGKPMAETPLHRDEMIRLIQTLQGAFADRPDVYVSGNMLLYYEEGNPRASVAPDVFVVDGVPKLPDRRIYRLWEEGAPPTFIVEVTSPSTRREDRAKKRDLYARLHVREYVLYDPLGEYLRPPLQGYRLREGGYIPMDIAHSALVSEALPIRLALDGSRLMLIDARTGTALLTPSERLAAELEVTRALISTLQQQVAVAQQQIAVAQQQAVAADARIAELERRLDQQTP